MPIGIDTTNLTEGRFREHWKRTKGKEPARFEQVAHAIQNGIPHGHAALVNKHGLKDAVRRSLAELSQELLPRRRGRFVVVGSSWPSASAVPSPGVSASSSKS